MNGVMMPSVSAGSSQREARVMCTPQVMVPSGAAPAGPAAPSVKKVPRMAESARHFGTRMVFPFMESGRALPRERLIAAILLWQPPASQDAFGELAHHHRKLHQAPECGERPPLERLVGEPDAREALDEGGDGELPLEPRERRAQAEMRAAAERAVMHVLARDVEAVGLRVFRGIAIGRG